MRPEDVPYEWVKKAALAVAEFNACGYCDGSCEGCTGEARHALAAVISEIRAEAWVEGRDDGLDDDGVTQTAIDYGEIVNPYEEKRTPADWCQMLGVTVLDPDGWRHDSTPFDSPITESEFRYRAALSTTRLVATAEEEKPGWHTDLAGKPVFDPPITATEEEA